MHYLTKCEYNTIENYHKEVSDDGWTLFKLGKNSDFAINGGILIKPVNKELLKYRWFNISNYPSMGIIGLKALQELGLMPTLVKYANEEKLYGTKEDEYRFIENIVFWAVKWLEETTPNYSKWATVMHFGENATWTDINSAISLAGCDYRLAENNNVTNIAGVTKSEDVESKGYRLVKCWYMFEGDKSLWNYGAIELEHGEGIKLADYLIKKGFKPIFAEDDATWYIPGICHWLDDIFYPFPIYPEPIIKKGGAVVGKN